MITARERAIRAIGEGGYQRLIDAGLFVDYKRRELEGTVKYPKGKLKIIGTVKSLDHPGNYYVVAYDENGFEILYDSDEESDYTKWIGQNNCRDFEVIG